jgi:hypothetical protein
MAESFTNGYALLIGVDESYVDDWALPDVAKDVAALAEVLTHPELCAYLKDHVKTLAGQEATRQGILDGLEWLQERVQADAGGNATAMIYYTGHGWQDEATQPPEFYLIPYDIRAGQIRSRALRAGDFAQAVGELRPQRLLVVLDCCHAAGMGVKDLRLTAPAGYVGAAMAPNLLMEGGKAVAGPGAKGLDTLTQGQGRAVLSSSTGEQLSWLRRDGTMSIFTYHLIEALTGHAQPKAGASEVLVSDVMSHVWRQVPESARADWDEDQTPDYQVSGNFPVALLLGGKGLGKGQPAPDPLETVSGQGAATAITQIDTGGGAYIGGNVTAGGDVVGRDKIVHGDEVHGDKVGGDKIDVGNVTGDGVAIGSGARAEVHKGDVYSGDFRGAILNIRSTLSNVTQSIGAIPQADDGTKAELERLVTQLEKALEEAVEQAPEKADDAEAVAEMTKTLVDTASAEKPNKTMIQISGEGLKQAAKNIADVMPTVLDIATKIVTVVAAFAV